MIELFPGYVVGHTVKLRVKGQWLGMLEFTHPPAAQPSPSTVTFHWQVKIFIVKELTQLLYRWSNPYGSHAVRDCGAKLERQTLKIEDWNNLRTRVQCED